MEDIPGLRTATYDALAQADLVHRRILRPVDLVRDAIARIEALNPTLNAVVHTDFDRAVETAARTDPDKPFAGVPILLEDLCVEADGLGCCEGSAFLSRHVSTGDQEYVRRLRKAGFVVLGKTNTPEFGLAPTTEPRLFGATANPWDPRFSAGGSSGGSAVAVAAGMVPVAHGSDVGGSLRIPASACHLFALKPTRGRNPLGPRYGEIFAGLGCEHVLTRSVRDSAALLDATAGPGLGDPYWTPPHAGSWLRETDRPPGRLRIAVTRRTPEGRPAHPDVLAAVDEMASLLESLGHLVFERDLDELTPEVGTAIGRIHGAALDWIIRSWSRELGRSPEPDELEPLTRLSWERGQQVTGGELLMCLTTVQRFTRALAAATDGPDGFDLWLSPTLAEPPPRLGELVAGDGDATAAEARSAAFAAFPLIAANLTGRPAMNVPFGWSEEGLPVGVHFLGRYGGEGTLLRVAAQLEQAHPWADLWPPFSARCLGHHHPLPV